MKRENNSIHELTIKITEDNHAIAEPGSITVFIGDTVAINPAGTNISLFFPDKNLFGIRTAHIFNGRKLLLKVQDVRQVTESPNNDDDDNEKNRYPYAVYCDAVNDFAEGASSPFMIVRSM